MSKVEKSSAQNNSNSNIMQSKYFSTFTLKDLGKEPTDEWSKNEKKTRFINKHKWKHQNLNQLSETYMKQNRGIVCGKHSDIIVVDLDFYDKYKKDKVISFDRANSKFLNDFGEDYIKKFNTLTFETGNGGHHLIFKYTPTIKTTTNEEHNIDIRSDNSYIVAPYSVIDKSKYNKSIKKAKDKKGEYKVIHEADIQVLPVELEAWLRMNLFRTKRQPQKRLKKNNKGEISSTDAYEQDEVDLTQYSYLFDESLIIDILDGLPKTYFKDNSKWYIFTTAMKLLSLSNPKMKDIWDMYSMNEAEEYYNEEENQKLWDCCSPNTFMCLEHLLNQSSYVHDAKTMMGYNKLRINEIHTKQHDKEINLRYLDKDNNGDFFKKIPNRYIIVRSDTGTGKTTAFKNYIKQSYEVQDGNYKRFISIVSRISLGKEQVKVFQEGSWITKEKTIYKEAEEVGKELVKEMKDDGIDCMWHEDVDEWWRVEGQNIVITIDSLMKMGNWEDFESYDIYLDEYNSLIEYFVDCPNLCNKRTIIWRYLNQILTQADRVIMTDADISDNSIKFLETLPEINRNEIIYINNKYKHNEGIEASELFTYEELIEQISTYPRAMVCLDSKNAGEKLVDDMKTKYNINFKYYSSDYSGDIDLDADDYVAFSPKIVYGLDSTMERPVFCYFKGQTISPPAMVQQINRCRKISHLYYLFESKTWKSYKYDDVDEVLFEIQEGKKLVVNYFDENYEKHESDRYDEILASFRFTLDCYNTNKFAHYLRLIKMRGFIITNELQYNDDKITKSTGLSNKLKEELQGKKAEQILEAWDKVCEEVIIDNTMDEEDIEDMKKLLLKEYLPETWVDIINLISLPFEKVGDEKYNVFMRDPQELERLFRTNTFFNNDTTELSKKLSTKEDFDSQKYQSSQSRFIYTKKLIDAVGLKWDNENKEMLMGCVMEKKTAEKLQKEYELTFRTRSKKLDFTQPCQVKSTIVRIMKLMFGKNIIDSQATSKSVDVMKMVEGKLQPTGKKKTQKITKHFINDEWVSLCKEIYGFYHGEDTGEGVNAYEIDTCEIE